MSDIEVQTKIEKKLGVTVVNPAYPPGDVRRYGATDNMKAIDDAQAVNRAMNPVLTKHDNEGFMECAECASKPGAPILCAACIHNRALIHRMAQELRQKNAAPDEPGAPLPHGTCVTLLLPGFPTMPREGWTVENIDEPRPLKYRIRHPNGSLLDVLPECIAVNRGDKYGG